MCAAENTITACKGRKLGKWDNTRNKTEAGEMREETPKREF